MLTLQAHSCSAWDSWKIQGTAKGTISAKVPREAKPVHLRREDGPLELHFARSQLCPQPWLRGAGLDTAAPTEGCSRGSAGAGRAAPGAEQRGWWWAGDALEIGSGEWEGEGADRSSTVLGLCTKSIGRCVSASHHVGFSFSDVWVSSPGASNVACVKQAQSASRQTSPCSKVQVMGSYWEKSCATGHILPYFLCQSSPVLVCTDVCGPGAIAHRASSWSHRKLAESRRIHMQTQHCAYQELDFQGINAPGSSCTVSKARKAAEGVVCIRGIFMTASKGLGKGCLYK